MNVLYSKKTFVASTVFSACLKQEAAIDGSVICYE